MIILSALQRELLEAVEGCKRLLAAVFDEDRHA
jgi:hypothetical protein